MRSIRPVRRRPAAGAAMALLSLLLLLLTIAAAAAANAAPFKSTRLPLPLGLWRDNCGGAPSSSSSSSRSRRRDGKIQQPLAFQAVHRRVMQLNNGTRLALAGALAGGFSNRECVCAICSNHHPSPSKQRW